jgi:hypothetical protein
LSYNCGKHIYGSKIESKTKGQVRNPALRRWEKISSSRPAWVTQQDSVPQNKNKQKKKKKKKKKEKKKTYKARALKHFKVNTDFKYFKVNRD